MRGMLCRGEIIGILQSLTLEGFSTEADLWYNYLQSMQAKVIGKVNSADSSCLRLAKAKAGLGAVGQYT